MSPKRKNDKNSEESSARERKKQKTLVARTIAVQPIRPDGENGIAGPSRRTGDSKQAYSLSYYDTSPPGMKGLPSVIDVEKFAEARAFEIDAMQKAMKSASASSTQRAWQTLPRHLRRRAASHDVRRVPLRLRDKARAEMDPARRKALGRSMPERGKDKRVGRTESFLRRQRTKTWLETHIWHAKRMHMENMWGYRLAVTPTEKAFRPSHRASVHGSIIHDASYFSMIELKGLEKITKALLEICCDPQGPSPAAKRFLTGARILETYIYKPGSYPFDLIAPITIIWKPIESGSGKGGQDDAPLADTTATAKPSINKKHKGKGTAMNAVHPDQPPQDLEVHRTAWIRSHPAVFDEVFGALQTSASLALDAARHDGNEVVDIELADLRGRLNIFEIMGPKSNQVLKGALTPVAEDKREEFKKFWSSLADLQTSGSLPRGMIVGFKVYDPRLKYPPKNARPRVDPSGALLHPIMTFPSSTLAQTEIWGERELNKPRYRKKDLDDRRAKNLIPGTPLSPLRQDDRVPVMLIQRSLENSSTGSDTQALHGWTVVLPAGWSMAFFSSLTATGTRVGGQRERQTQAFEAGVTYFPRDYPFTGAYDAYANAREVEEQARWDRKPPAKRPNFEKLGTRSPWRPDWEIVLGLQVGRGDEAGEEEFVTTQRDDPSLLGDKPGRKQDTPWLLRGPEVTTIIANAGILFSPAPGLLAEVNKLRLKRFQDPLDVSVDAEQLLKGALVTVGLKLCGRGSPDDLAVIYAVEDEEARKWNKMMELKENPASSEISDESPDEIYLSALRPSQESIIGYTTTGNFSLSRGEGFTIGAIPVSRVFQLQQQAHRLHGNTGVSTPKSTPPLLVKIRNRDGDRCRPAHLHVIVA